ncbi:hypothetical protein K3G39_18965 [Pontibacter sp. HSC-14F20]|uniref:hypothetical protein n=1 Tax=Pontibacter sp. HSC-14F20 TaxID=2864136 RepID=UPI001C7319FD|nr:hypothetical protein [Pontibacter sp. HSC-14F20]MBX0335321.1 hypothetical protein [Pontibacter sp. HSC-14F20]
MKNIFTLLLIISCHFALAQQKSVELKLRTFKSKNNNVDSLMALNAIKLANLVLNSQEFRDSIGKYDFKCENYGEACSSDRIKGSVILDSIYRNSTFELDLLMKNCITEYGHSEEGKNYIQSCYKKLRKDDKKLPFSYIYAYHICHEYMHIVGYYHTDHKDDVAEKVGWISYHILNRWYDEKRNLN